MRKSDYYSQRVKLLKEHFGKKKIEQIGLPDLEEFAIRRARKVSASTVRKDLTVLGTMFKRAVRWGVLEVSPAVDLDKPREPKHRERFLSKDEYSTIRDRAAPWLKPFIRLAVVTGLRRKELVNLCWDDIDWENKLIHVSEDNKTDTPRVVPMGEVAREVLSSQVRHVRRAFVFLDASGKPYTSMSGKAKISKAIKAIMRTEGIEGAPVHILRHTAASWAAQAGESGLLIAQFLGHASGRTITERYIHLKPEHLSGIVWALDQAEQAKAPQTAPCSEVGLEESGGESPKA